MQTNQFTQLTAAFRERSDTVRDRLSDLLLLVNEGRIPTKEAMTDLNESVTDLNDRYTAMYDAAKSLLTEEELPANGSTWQEIADAVQNSRSRFVAEQLAHAQELLNKFLRVRSEVEQYAAALAPYQQKAQALLELISETSAEEVLPEIEAPELFVQAVETENIHNAEGIALLGKLKTLYPEDMIQFGLIGKQYYLGEEVVLPEASATVENEPPEEPVAEELPEETPEEPVAEELPEETVELPTDETENEAPVEPEEEKKIFRVTNKVKTETPNVSSFKKEFMQICKQAQAARGILPLFTHVGVLSKQQIYAFVLLLYSDIPGFSKKFTEEYIGAVVDLLVDKGYLACLCCEDAMPLYCLSDYCCTIMHKDTIMHQQGNLWPIVYGFVKVSTSTGLDEDTALRYVLSNDALIFYLKAQKCQLSATAYKKVKSSFRWTKDHYEVMVPTEGEEVTAYVVAPYNVAPVNEPPYPEVSTIGAKYLLLISGEDLYDMPTCFSADCMKLFVVKQDTVYTCSPGNDVEKQLETLTDLEKPVDIDEEVQAAVEELPEAPDLTEPELIEPFEPEEYEPEQAEPTESETSEPDEETPTPTTATASDPTLEDLIRRREAPSDEEFCYRIHALLHDEPGDKKAVARAMVQAVLLAKGAGLEPDRPMSRQLSAQLRLATNMLPGECAYTSDFLSETFDDSKEDVPALTLAAYMHAMLTPAVAYDYTLKANVDSCLDHFDTDFEELQAFKALFNQLTRIFDVKPAGFTPAVVSLLGNDTASEQFLKDLQVRAQDCCVKVNATTNMKALPRLYHLAFEKGSDLYTCVEAIAAGHTDENTLDFVEAELEKYCDKTGNTFRLNDKKIDERLDAVWEQANSRSNFKLEFDAREKAIRQYRNRLEVMLTWVEHIRSRSVEKGNLERLKSLKEGILKEVKILQTDRSWCEVKDAKVLRWLLYYMTDYLNGELSQIQIYEDILYTGVFSMNLDGTPKIDESLAGVLYYEPWRNALRHIAAERRSAEEIADEVWGDKTDGENRLRDNLRQVAMLGKLLGSKDERYIVSEQNKKDALALAKQLTDKFKGKLEIAYAYDQINEIEKESAFSVLTQYKPGFDAVCDCACWRQLLNALERQVEELTEARKEVVETRLNERLKDSPDSSLLLEAKRLLEETSNFAVTEEYLNRYEAGEKELADPLLSGKNYFAEFLSDEEFLPLLRECNRWKGYSFRTFAPRYLDRNKPENWGSNLQQESRHLLSCWPIGGTAATSTQVLDLFKGLGLEVEKATKVTDAKAAKLKEAKGELWQLTVKPTEKSLADYLHPIAAFGTQVKSPINVIFLYGIRPDKQLVDTVTSMNLGGLSLVVVDHPIDAAGRRNIGEIFHTQTSGQNSFLLIDQVLMLYLAKHPKTERLPALLQCTLPYTTYQPFVRDGGSTADEMFCGRARELAALMDLNGANVVYGGRQLGKTALLERTESLCSKPNDRQFAVYSNIVGITTEQAVVEILVNDIHRKTDGMVALAPCTTIKEMCDQLTEMFQNGKIATMHLLIDEVDAFMGAIAADRYAPMQPLVYMNRVRKDFKFVIAGLHNVCRAKNATIDNGSFGQVGTPLCIKPLSPADALELLSRPLRYLGFQIDRSLQLETILTNTNYYPGILQFFGYILVETFTGQYTKYYTASKGNPPFTLTKEQLGAVMNSSDLNKSIKDKFRWSLELDPRYFMIARCITYRYHLYKDDHKTDHWRGIRGISVEEIMEVAEAYEIHCLENLNEYEYIALLDEMVDMGILGKPDAGVNAYRLRRDSFIDIIGHDAEAVEKAIEGNN